MKSLSLLKAYAFSFAVLILIYGVETKFDLKSLKNGILVGLIQCIVGATAGIVALLQIRKIRFAQKSLLIKNVDAHSKSGNELRSTEKAFLFLAIGFLCFTFADFFWTFLYYKINLDRKHWISVSLTQLPYGFGYFCWIFSILNISTRQIFTKSILKFLWIPALLITLPCLRLIAFPTLLAWIHEGPSYFLFGHTVNILGTFILLNLSVVTLLTRRDLFWSLITSGCAVLVIENWSFRAEMFLFGTPSYGYYDYLWAFGLITAAFPILSLSHFRDEGSPVRAIELNSLVSQSRLWIMSSILGCLAAIALITTPKFFILRIISLGSISAILISVFLSQFLAEKIEQFALLLSLEVTDELGISAISDKHNKPPIELLTIYRQVFEEKLKEKRKQEEFSLKIAQIASQVAHDIRSPLAALQVILPILNQVQEDYRILISSAINRIKDICNDLLAKYPTSNPEINSKIMPRSELLLATLIDSIISEKRVQYRAKVGLEIEFLINKSNFGLFAKISSAELGRVISNVVNNSVEAMKESGRVEVSLSASNCYAIISIDDNGCGIKPDVMPNVMKRGMTYGKLGGLGIGLAYAKEIIEKFGGTIEIESAVNRGTNVTFKIPKCSEPSWFASKILVKRNSVVIVMDDESSIHQLWRGRFEKHLVNNEIQGIYKFTNLIDLKNWLFSNVLEFSSHFVHAPLTNDLDSKKCVDLKNETENYCAKRFGISDIVLLCDYNLVGSSESGLDFICRMELCQHSVLVTSHFEDPSVQEKCQQVGIDIVPKVFAGFVPIEIL